MILECPECGTRYLVPDSALGAEGRTVRCAQCRHSWFQEAELPNRPPATAAPAMLDPAVPPDTGTAASPAPTAAPSPPAPPPAPVAGLVGTYPAAAADIPARRPRRNVARIRTYASLAAGLLMLLVIGIIVWTSAPGLAQQVGLSFGAAEPVLRIADNTIERRRLQSGAELFAVSGRVINPSAAQQRVPDLRADLRDAQGRIVFSWTITPQQRTLAPNGAVDFNSAQVDVPASSKRLDLSFVGETS